MITRRSLFGAAAAGVALAACGKVPGVPTSGGNPSASFTDLQGTSTAPVTLMLDWYPNSDHAGIYGAVAQGAFKQRGLAVTIQTPSDTTEQIQLVATGKADFAVSYEPDVLSARGQGLPVQAVFALVQVPLNCIIVPKASGITHPAQLQGKKVGTPGLPGDTAVLDSAVRFDHGDPTKVQNVNVGFDLVTSLLGHKVDALVGGYWNWEAVQLAEQGMPVNTLRLQDWGIPNYNELVVIAADDTVKNRPNLVKDFAAALAAGTTYAIAHPDQSLSELLQANPSLDKTLVQTSLQLLQPAWKAGAPEVGYMDPKGWQSFADWMLQEKWLPKAVDAGQAMTDTFVPKA